MKAREKWLSEVLPCKTQSQVLEVYRKNVFINKLDKEQIVCGHNMDKVITSLRFYICELNQLLLFYRINIFVLVSNNWTPIIFF